VSTNYRDSVDSFVSLSSQVSGDSIDTRNVCDLSGKSYHSGVLPLRNESSHVSTDSRDSVDSFVSLSSQVS